FALSGTGCVTTQYSIKPGTPPDDESFGVSMKYFAFPLPLSVKYALMSVDVCLPLKLGQPVPPPVANAPVATVTAVNAPSAISAPQSSAFRYMSRLLVRRSRSGARHETLQRRSHAAADMPQ